MKRTCLFLLIIVSTFWVNATISAARCSPGSQQTSDETVVKSTTNLPPDARPAGRSDHELGGRLSKGRREASAERTRAPAHANRIVSSRTPQIPKRGRVRPAPFSTLRPQGRNRSGELAKEGTIRTNPHGVALSTPPTTPARPTTPLLAPVRHRATNSAVIGGPANQARGATSISGTGMKRKP